MAKEGDYNSLRESRPSYKEVRRKMQTTPNSIDNELKEIGKKYESSLKKVIDTVRLRLPYPEVKRDHPHPAYINDESKPLENNLTETEAKNYYDAVFSENLSAFNTSLLRGDFNFAKMMIKELNYFTKGSKLNKIYVKEEKEKLVEGIDNRIKRGMNYLKKHPSRESLEEMKDILKYRKQIEENLNNKKSSLEKTLGVASLGVVVVSLFLLSPNLTGNVIGSLAKNETNIFGGLLFILGLLGVFIVKKF